MKNQAAKAFGSHYKPQIIRGSEKIELNKHKKWENDTEDESGEESGSEKYEKESDDASEGNVEAYYGSESEEEQDDVEEYDNDGSESSQAEDSDSSDADSYDNDTVPVKEDTKKSSNKGLPLTKAKVSKPANVPLYKLLAQSKASKAAEAAAAQEGISHFKSRPPKKMKRDEFDRENGEESGKRKKSKNAPTEMRSDRPVRRLRVDADNSVRKTVDPRFVEYTGELNQRIYAKNYAFIQDYREKEVEMLTTAFKKAKNTHEAEEIREELLKYKQQLKQRQVAMKAMDKIDEIQREERDKVKAGLKKPYFLKGSAKKQIALDEKFKELKKDGKLKKYMDRKQKKQMSKGKKWMPNRRPDSY